MKPPIPNIIAHSEEPESNFILPIAIVLIIVAVTAFLYFTKPKVNDKIS